MGGEGYGVGVWQDKVFLSNLVSFLLPFFNERVPRFSPLSGEIFFSLHSYR